ncbi:hypothetical protein [Hydrogenoanaerobacterium sp.]|uniref:hypothetical protein n=1 Tax=Hydrogenoanaerobacterium sp. TaxID=2953763 RepID=UPI0028986E62|nr:hypothetical protein [Hydrogenoanaerobacterium sp.]
MDQMMNAWEQFLRTGKVSDYLRYRQSLGVLPNDNDFIEGEEYPDADEYTGGGNRFTGY